MKTVLSKGSFRERDENEHSILLPDFSTFLIFEQLPKLATIITMNVYLCNGEKPSNLMGNVRKTAGLIQPFYCNGTIEL